MTNNYPGIGYKTQGNDFNFFQKVTVTASTFGGGSVSGAQPDIIIKFATQGIYLLNEGTLSTQVIEYSFNGSNLHGELDPTLPSRGLMFDNRQVSMIWFRLKAGSSSTVLSVAAW